MRSRSSLSFVCVAMLIAAGCASGTHSTQLVDSSELSSESNSASTSSETDAELTLSITHEATSTATDPTEEATPDIYDWSASRVGGGSIDLAGYANTAVVLWFWSPY